MEPNEEEPFHVALCEFASTLCRSDPDVFGSEERILTIFRNLDRQYMEIVNAHPITDVCTHERRRSSCWAFYHRPVWNFIMNKRGIELTVFQNIDLKFRTMDVYTEDLEQADDVKVLCLSLWLLRHHRCITAVSLCLPVVAPRHRNLFMELLQFTGDVRWLALHGEELFRKKDDPTYDDEATAAFTAVRWTHKLNNLSLLRELVLSNLHASGDAAEDFISCVKRNKLLSVLILIDVEMSADTFNSIVDELVKRKNFEDFRIKITETQRNEFTGGTLYKIGQSRSLLRFYVYSACTTEGRLTAAQNSSLRELIFEPPISSAATLGEIREVLQVCQWRVRLKICVDLSARTASPDTLWNLLDIIQEKSLQVLVLTGSTISYNESLRIADALESSNLIELHLDKCNIMCAAILPFINAVRRLKPENPKFKELNLGVVTGPPGEQAWAQQMIVFYGVQRCIRVVFTDFLDNYSTWITAGKGMRDFSEISLTFSETTPSDGFLTELADTATWLECLTIYTNQVLSLHAMKMLGEVIKRNVLLKVVRLRFRTEKDYAKDVLSAVANSKSVVLLAIQGWDWNDKMLEGLHRMLRDNVSLYRLELYWDKDEYYMPLKGCLQRALKKDTSVVVVKMYRLDGAGYIEVPLRDFSILKFLHRNETTFDWAMDRLARCRMGEPLEVVAEILNICSSPLYSRRRTVDLAPCIVQSMERLDRVATRTDYYSLSFGDPYFLGLCRTSDATGVLHYHISIMRNLVETNGPRVALREEPLL